MPADDFYMYNNRILWWVVLFGIGIWQVGSMLIAPKILLPSPIETFSTLLSLIGDYVFWYTIVLRIGHGFITAIITGVMFAVFAYCSTIFKQRLYQ